MHALQKLVCPKIWPPTETAAGALLGTQQLGLEVTDLTVLVTCQLICIALIGSVT